MKYYLFKVKNVDGPKCLVGDTYYIINNKYLGYIDKRLGPVSLSSNSKIDYLESRTIRRYQPIGYVSVTNLSKADNELHIAFTKNLRMTEFQKDNLIEIYGFQLYNTGDWYKIVHTSPNSTKTVLRKCDGDQAMFGNEEDY